MTEYINRETAIEAIAFRLAINKDDYERAERQAVDWLPEAEEDVVKVVRCKDCKWWGYVDDKGPVRVCHAAKHGYKSKNWDIGIYRTYNEEFYCSDGERLDI